MINVSGDFEKWSAVTLDIEGPSGSESATTFVDRRLDVTFTHAETGETYTVPGYFAADGNAAETGAVAGNVWKVHFTPPKEGSWSYEVSFVTGSGVAVDRSKAGTAVAGLDGETGSFDISDTTKTGDDLRSKGTLTYDGDQYLNYADGSVFLKSGVGAPENFLAYEEFDNTIQDGETHDYAPHLQDYNSEADDLLWNGKGKEIFGAVNYLASEGVNSFYMMLMNVGGDGRDVWPWSADDLNDINKNASEPNKSNQVQLTTEAQSFDVSKLAQWERVFQYMEEKGMALHLFLQETENDFLLNDGELGLERQLFIREMVARFGHHNGIIWNLGEENTNTAGQLRDHSAYLQEMDAYGHAVALHTYPGQHNKYSDFKGEDTLDVYSFQTSGDTQVPDLDKFLGEAEAAGRPAVAFLDEPGNASVGMAAEGDNGWQQNHANLRATLWEFYSQGGSGAEWYFGYQTDGGEGGDLKLEDFRTRDSAYDWALAARELLEGLPLEDMSDHDNLASNSDTVFADPGAVYVIYLEDGGTTNLNLTGEAGTYSVKWYNPRVGGPMQDGSVTSVTGGGQVSLGQPPADANKDWVVLVEATGDQPPPPDEGDVYQMEDGLVVIQAEDGAFLIPGASGNSTWSLETDQPGYKGDGYLKFDTNKDYFNTKNAGTPETGPIAYTFRIDGDAEDVSGTYFITLRSIKPNTGEENDRNNDFFVAAGEAGSEPQGWKKVFFSGGANKWLWGKTYDVNHVKSPATFEVDGPGEYTVWVSGRSRQAGLDEIHVQKGSANTDDDAPTSPLVDGGSITPPPPPPPPPEPTEPGALAETEYLDVFLAYTDTDETLSLDEPGQIVLADIDGRSVTIYAEAKQSVGSVELIMPGVTSQVENVEPYALFGDTGGDFKPGTQLTVGTYQVTMNVYAGADATGALLESTTLPFEVVAEATAARMEVGEVVAGATGADDWHVVSFGEEIPDARVVMGPPSMNGGQDAVIRVRNVTDQGFEFQIDEWAYLDQAHKVETIGWIAVSEGTHTLSDGRTVTSGRTELSDETPTDVALTHGSAPAVLGQVTSHNGSATVVDRIYDVSDSGFTVRMQEAEDADGQHATESFDWIAIDLGDGDLDAALVDDVTSNWTDVATDAPVLLASMQTFNGRDPAALRFTDSAQGHTLKIREETSVDAERYHVAEQVAVVTAEVGVVDLA